VGVELPARGTADASQGFPSGFFDLSASVFDGTDAVGKRFRLRVDPINNNDPGASVHLGLSFSSGRAPQAPTGVSIALTAPSQ
jgi:hypothetical protein